MKPAYHPSIEDNTQSVMQVARVHYVNSIPGAGKTRAALQFAVETLHNHGTADHVLVYAAPTHKLLSQFYNDLSRKVTNKRHMKHVHVITGTRSHLPVHTQFAALLNSYSDADIVMKQVPNGSVILVTHECLRKIPVDQPGKNRVSLIFDEARQCMQLTMNMKAPINVVEFVRTGHVINSEALPSTAVARWSWRSDARIDENQIRSLWKESHPRPNKREVQKFMSFIEALRNDSQHIWVKLDAEASQLQDFQVNVTMSPSRLFANYGKVLIMSAFFEYSQMFHMLKRQECDLTTRAGIKRAVLLDPEDRVSLVNVTDALINNERVRRILGRRLSRATMTYVLKDESLSKYHINQGIVIDYKTGAELIQFSKRYQELFDAENTGAAKPSSFRAFLNVIRNTTDGTTVTRSALKRSKLLLSLKPSKLSVVQHLALQSSKLQRAWLARMNRPKEPLLLCVNSKANHGDHSSVWLSEQLDKLNVGEERVQEVPVVNQGLNKWMASNTAAFMATVKMPPDQIRFLKTLLPDYNPDLDRTVDQCIQFIFRSSLRDAKSVANCLLVVSDYKLAEQVNQTLGGHIKLIAPQSLLPKWSQKSIATFRPTESSHAHIARNRKYQQTDKYKTYKKQYNQTRAQTDHGRAYAKLSATINRRSARLKKDPSNQKLMIEVNQLREQRANLRKN